MDLKEINDLTISREDLYALVWSMPMLDVAKQFKVSSSYMARVCTRLNVPRPARGYWAKISAGKLHQKIPLPEFRPGDQLVWSRDGRNFDDPRPLSKPPVDRKSARKTSRPSNSQHVLVRGAKEHFESARLSEEGYLKPAKKLLVDLAVTTLTLDKALSFANSFFMGLEENGHRVVIAPQSERFNREAVDERESPGKGYHFNSLWSPMRETVAYIGTVAIGLTIIELSEEVEVRYINGEYVREKDYVAPKRGKHFTWTTTKFLPTGRLCLQAYSPYPMARRKRIWKETTTKSLDTQIKNIVAELESAAVEISQLVEEGMRRQETERKQREAQQEIWRREQEERQVAEAIKKSKEELKNIIDRWAESNRVEQFFLEVERHASNLEEGERGKILERLRHARELIGSKDALDHFLGWYFPGN